MKQIQPKIEAIKLPIVRIEVTVQKVLGVVLCVKLLLFVGNLEAAAEAEQTPFCRPERRRSLVQTVVNSYVAYPSINHRLVFDFFFRDGVDWRIVLVS